MGAERETESKTGRDPEYRTQTPQRPKRAWEGREGREGRRRRGPGIAPGPQKLRAPRFPLPAEPEAGVPRVLPQEEGLAGFSRHPGRPQGPQRRPRQPHRVPTALLWKPQGAPNSPSLCVGAAGTPCSQRAGTRALTKAGGAQRIVGETPGSVLAGNRKSRQPGGRQAGAGWTPQGLPSASPGEKERAKTPPGRGSRRHRLPRDGAGGAGEPSPRPRGTPRETALYKEVHKAPKAVKMAGGPRREGP